MSTPKLPVCSIQYPSCGACGLDTDHDGDTFYCEECGLDYGNGEDGRVATYRDEEQSPCEAACDNTWHKDGAIGDGWTFTCVTCTLPTGHTSDHWVDCGVNNP